VDTHLTQDELSDNGRMQHACFGAHRACSRIGPSYPEVLSR